MSDGNFELMMPFVTTRSNGGPHEDHSYVMGYEMGHLDVTLRTLAAVNAYWWPATVQIHTENQPQADLLAMRHKLAATFEEVEGCPEWIQMHIEKKPLFEAPEAVAGDE